MSTIGIEDAQRRHVSSCDDEWDTPDRGVGEGQWEDKTDEWARDDEETEPLDPPGYPAGEGEEGDSTEEGEEGGETDCAEEG
jgi:hypothetical protein